MGENRLTQIVNQIRPSKEFRDIINFIRAKCILEGKITPSAAKITKIIAKKMAVKCKVPIIESNKKKLTSLKVALSQATEIGYPLMLKAASGGGGRGMRVIHTSEDLEKSFDSAKN